MLSACLLRAKKMHQRSRSNADTGERRTQNRVNAKFRDIVSKLRRNVAQIQAVMLVGPHGLVDHVADDPALNLETIAEEYATLLRIARSALEDSEAGSLVENVLVSEQSVVIARSVSPDHYLILLSGAQDQIGRARYELKQAAWEISNSG
jgi:predicted regulator of Ras-like GTPase activity (Roadblock/LC7/MglB family)